MRNVSFFADVKYMDLLTVGCSEQEACFQFLQKSFPLDFFFRIEETQLILSTCAFF